PGLTCWKSITFQIPLSTLTVKPVLKSFTEIIHFPPNYPSYKIIRSFVDLVKRCKQFFVTNTSSSILTPPSPSTYIPGSNVTHIFSSRTISDFCDNAGPSCTSNPIPCPRECPNCSP